MEESVPRILVADDNSNIHRAVALALKDVGVEVVAVGNGEAAVRKVAEIKPDLVLADIFMPVRSGYEVCEFVKQDPRFAGVPVVLLVGAFDPFDEREAQRVQADAILKKPFVPADSLVRTVTDLLAQSVSRSAPAPAPAAPAVAKPEPPPAAAVPASPAQEFADEPVEAFEPPKARLEWNSDDQPIAFGTLLETPANDSDNDASVVTSRRDPNLGEPAFWAPKAKPEAEPGESEEDNSEPESSTGFGDEEQWNSGGVLDELPEQPPTVSKIEQPALLDEVHDSEFELSEEPALPPNLLSRKPAEAPLKPLQASTERSPKLPELDLPEVENLEELPALETFAAPAPLKAEVPKQEAEAEPEALPDLKDFAWATPSYEAEQTQVVRDLQPDEEADTIPEKSSEPPAPALATLAPFLASLTSGSSARAAGREQERVELEAVPALSEDFESEPAGLETEEPFDAPETSQLDPAVIEAIAQRVIERMQPKIIELVTRELLRPAVEALVQRELEKK
jgi:CheY-like chemotaxis protein